jgi:hypothetical protein
VNSVLTALGKTADEVTCIGDQFPGQWNNLAGTTVAPYTCDFTDKWLLIDATIAVTGPNGQIYVLFGLSPDGFDQIGDFTVARSLGSGRA